MEINLYQINERRDTQHLRGQGLAEIRNVLGLTEGQVDWSVYDRTYHGEIAGRTLGDIYKALRFRLADRVAGGKRVGVSDIIEVVSSDTVRTGSFFCDQAVFREVPFDRELAGDPISPLRVLFCEPGKEARVTELGRSLGDLQDAVGGQIEVVYPFAYSSVCLVCNDEGSAKRSRGKSAGRAA